MRTILVLLSMLVSLPAAAQLRDELKMPPPPAPPAAAAPPRDGAVVRLSLHDAVERALAVDPQTATAVVNRQRGQLALLRAQLDRFSLKVDASLAENYQAFNFWLTAQPPGWEGTPLKTSSGLAGIFNLGATLQVPIFAGHRVSANVSKARHQRDAAAANQNVTARSLALATLQSYWAVRRVELQRTVSADALARYEEAMTVVSARVRAGLAPPVDVNRMETRRQRERARLVGLEGTAREGRAQLAVALGYGGADLELTEAAEVPPPPPTGPDEVDRLLRDARHARPELRAARLQTLALEDQVKMARSGYWPQLAAVGQFGYGTAYSASLAPYLGGGAANPFSSLAGQFFIGATLSINLFDTFNTKTQVRDAEYQVALQRQEERRLGRLVEADVRTANARLQRLYAAREPLIKTRDLAKDTLDIIGRRYRNGEATVLDYLDAQFDLLNSEIDLADSAAAIAQTWGELWAATGRIPGAK